ncbi:hypothetical protein KCP69_04605 [Salmonella enterica subsp. enterica]|nr:hypothetical protein KCP69_04605 [Salmonella enterica subsp. enterica]
MRAPSSRYWIKSRNLRICCGIRVTPKSFRKPTSAAALFLIKPRVSGPISESRGAETVVRELVASAVKTCEISRRGAGICFDMHAPRITVHTVRNGAKAVSGDGPKSSAA